MSLLHHRGVNTSSQRQKLPWANSLGSPSSPHGCCVPPWHPYESQSPFILQPHYRHKQPHTHQTKRSDHDRRCVPCCYCTLYAKNFWVDKHIKLKLAEQQSVPASPRVQQMCPEAVSSHRAQQRKDSTLQPASTLPEPGFGRDTSSHSERNRCGQV